MKKLMAWLFAVTVVLGVASVTVAQEAAYILAVGDPIRIHVFEEPDLTFDRLQINDAGSIAFPFLGEIKAAGKTTTQLQQLIVQGLKPDYLLDPIVTVTVLEYRPFFLDGEVTRPGNYPFQPGGLTLRQAITMAGGLTERAAENKITVVPAGKKEESKVGMDYQIKPGDTIKIGQSFF